MTTTTLCYIENDDKFLMLHRVKKQDDMNEGKWIGVGGHVESQETPEDVELICDIDYMGDGKPCHFMDIYRPRKIMKVLPSYIYGKHWKKSSFYPYINPENKEIIRNLPPSFLVTAYGDTLRNYSRQYAKAIKKAGVICHLEDYEVDKKLPHAFSTTFPEMEESKRANTQMVEFLLKY